MFHLLEPICSNLDSGSCTQAVCGEADEKERVRERWREGWGREKERERGRDREREERETENEYEQYISQDSYSMLLPPMSTFP